MKAQCISQYRITAVTTTPNLRHLMQEEYVYYSCNKSKAGREEVLLHAIIQGPRLPPSCSSVSLKVLRVLAMQREDGEGENMMLL